jgi:hypothetical protein
VAVQNELPCFVSRRAFQPLPSSQAALSGQPASGGGDAARERVAAK